MTNPEENIDVGDLLKREYMLHLLRTGEQPVTVFRFCEDLGLEESDFYDRFNSFGAIEKQIWVDFFKTTVAALEDDQEFPNYTSHEKVLSFLYTIVEVFKQNRSFVSFRGAELNVKSFRPWYLASFREEFNQWIKEVLGDGFASDEIVNRPLVSAKYYEVLWGQFLYIFRVWVKDESEGYQVTDAAIEKSSALLFELMKKGPVDLMIDFLKFAYQNKAY